MTRISPYPQGLRPVPKPAPQSNRNIQAEKIEHRKNIYDQIYELEMLECTYFDGYTIQRVPGGWIFERSNGSVFIPYTSKEINLDIEEKQYRL